MLDLAPAIAAETPGGNVTLNHNQPLNGLSVGDSQDLTVFLQHE